MIRIAGYRSRLRTPMRFGGETFTERHGFFVEVEGSAGSGVGEVAPLPGVHRESVEDCLQALRRRTTFPRSLAFGMSVARAIAEGDPVMTRPLRDRVGVNSLVVDELDAASLRNPRTIKVKIGRRDAVTERAMLDGILKRFPAARLRLDGNRGMSLDGCARLLEGIDVARIEYLEEPLSDPLQLPALHFRSGCSIALDESLHDPELRAALETAPGVTTHVVKPSLIGELLAVRERAERTARQGLRTTITSTFESSYTLHVLARLITWLPNADGDHGLGTAGMLLEDPCAAPSVESGWISTQGSLPRPRIAFTSLEVLDVP